MGEGHDHSHAPADFGKAFAVGVALNTAYVIAEAGVGLRIGSMALVADAGHNLSDVLGLLVAWGATALARRKPSKERTYGLRRTSILAALFNALFLLVAMGAVAWEAIGRFGHPAEVPGRTVVLVALAGIVVNAGTAAMFMAGRKGDINIRGAYLHMAADAAVSLGVVVAGGVMLYTHWAWIDPVVSLVIVAVVVFGTWSLLRDSVNMALDAVPGHIELAEVQAYLASLPGVTAVHDLHVWGMSTTETALTAHLVVPDLASHDTILGQACRVLHERFEIAHSTLQLETGMLGVDCELEPDDVV